MDQPLNNQQDPTPSQPPRRGNDFDLGLLFYLARKSLLWVIAFFLMAVVCVMIYLRYAQPIFESYTVLQITSNNRAQKLGIEDIYETDEISGEIELLRSKEFMKRVLGTLPLEIRYFTKGEFLTNENYMSSVYHLELDTVLNKEAYNFQYFINFPAPDQIQVRYENNGSQYDNTFSIYKPIKTPHLEFRITKLDYARYKSETSEGQDNEMYFTVNKTDNLVAELFPFLEVRLLNNAARTVRISFQDNSSAKAKDIAAAMANEFKNFDRERKGESAKKILSFINERLGDVSSELELSESQLHDLQRQGQLPGGSAETSRVLLQNIKELEREVLTLELRENRLTEIESTIKSQDLEADIYKLLPLLNSVSLDYNLSEQVGGLHRLLTEKEELFFEVTTKSVEIENLNYRIEIQKKLVLNSILTLRQTVTSQKKLVQDKLAVIENDLIQVPQKQVEMSNLERIKDINEKFVNLLFEKKQEYQISEAGLVSEYRILEQATISNSPIYPSKMIAFAVGLAVAAMISILLVALRYFMHNDITNVGEIARLSRANVSILGIIPRYKKDIPVSQLLVDKRPKSLIAESFRSVRTNLQFIANDKESRIIAVTSTISGEGKTFVAINLGGIIAFSGKKVIILDLDMRKPKIHLGFNAQNDVGMSTLLIGKNKIEETIKQSDLDNLSFITAGPIPPNPSELIISGKLDMILEELKKTYDIIIMDNPPVGLVTDGIYCIQKADYPIYIFRSEYSKRQFVQNVDHLMKENKIRNLSVILNGVDVQRSGYGYNYGYGYGYGSGYGYGYGYRYGYGYQYGYGSTGYGYGYYDDSSPEKVPIWKRLFGGKKDK